jgi:hypothetical protein
MEVDAGHFGKDRTENGIPFWFSGAFETSMATPFVHFITYSGRICLTANNKPAPTGR